MAPATNTESLVDGSKWALPKGSLVLVGMPGAMQTAIGKHMEKQYGLSWVDVNAAVAASAGMASAKDFIAKNGMPAFRQKEKAELEKACGAKTEIVTCGGGVLETSWDFLQKNHTTVYVNRPLEDLDPKTDGGEGHHLPKPIEALFEERKDKFEKMNFIFQSNWDTELEAGNAFQHYYRMMFRHPCPKPATVCLCFHKCPKNFWNAAYEYYELCADEIDQDGSKLDEALEELKKTQGKRSVGMPNFYDTIFTLRSEAEGGKWKGTQQAKEKAYKAAAQTGCCLFDIEAAQDDFDFDRSCILSINSEDWGPIRKTLMEKRKKYNVWLYKICTMSWHKKKVEKLIEELDRPVCVWYKDEYRSLVMNTYLTPCYAGEADADPENFKMYDEGVVNKRREWFFMKLQLKHYHIVGDVENAPVHMSPEIDWHNEYFRRCMPLHYADYFYAHADDVRKIEARMLVDSKCLGVVLHVPSHKSGVVNWMDHTSEAVDKIGAANLLWRDGEAIATASYAKTVMIWHGENTEWESLKQECDRVIAETPSAQEEKWCIVGTDETARAAAYAMEKLKIQCTVVGEDVEKAKQIAKDFSLPGGGQPMSNSANFQYVVTCVPTWVDVKLGKNAKVLDMKYGGPHHKRPGTIVDGLTLLKLQAVKHIQMWPKTEEVPDPNVHLNTLCMKMKPLHHELLKDIVTDIPKKRAPYFNLELVPGTAVFREKTVSA